MEQAICKGCKGQGPKLGLYRGRCMGCNQEQYRRHLHVRIERRVRRWFFVQFTNDPMRMEDNLKDRVERKVRELVCRIRGHRVIGYTIANEEMGQDVLCCATCDQDFSVIYY